jgi:phosphatidate cytidylyltransferase
LKDLLRRTLTGIFIVIFVLGGFWLHPVSFFITGLVMVTGTQAEYFRILKRDGARPQTVMGLVTGATVYTVASFVAAGYISADWFLVAVPLIVLIFTAELYRKLEKPFDSLAHTFFPVIYTVLPFSLFPFSAFNHSGLVPLAGDANISFSPGIIVGFFILLMVNDSAAYLVGITLGRHRLMERISPRKSWEGFIGGIVFSLILAWILSPWLGVTDRKGWLVISVIISVAGTISDLVESMFKRSYGIKDSGTIMPGHGGFLDRFDGAILSFPLVYLYLSLFG